MRRDSLCRVAAAVVGATVAATAAAQDWPQLRGPGRLNEAPMASLGIDWSAELRPTPVWVYDRGGTGYGGPIVVGDRVWMMTLRDGLEGVACLDAATGAELWWEGLSDTRPIPCCCLVGPRSTPTYDDGRLFALSSTGMAVCLDADSGDERWHVDLVELGGEAPSFGYAESLLVAGDQVLCTPGGDEGGVVALDRETGAVRWRIVEPTGPARYTSIVPLAGAAPRYAQFRGGKIVVFDDAGRVIAVHPWEHGSEWQATSVFPLPDGSFYAIGQNGSELCDLTDAGVVPRYSNAKPTTYHPGAVLVEGRVYEAYRGAASIHELATGERVRELRDAWGSGPIIAGDGVVLVVDAAKREPAARVTLFRTAQPDTVRSFTIDRRSRSFDDGSSYNGMVTHPVVAGGRLYVRDQELLHCLDLRSLPTPALAEPPAG